MTYCEKWQALGLTIGLAPLAISFILTVLVARWPRRLWTAMALAFLVFASTLAAGRAASLVVWNGVAPAPSQCEF